MTRGLLNLFKKDLVIAFRNALFWVLLVTLVLMIVSIRFLIPDNYQETENRYYYDNSSDKLLENIIKSAGIEDKYLLDNEEELEKEVGESANGLGIIFEGSIQSPKFTIIHQANINSYQRNIIDASLEKLVANITGVNRLGGYEVEFLRQQAQPVSRRLTALPSLLTFEVLILGFLFIAVFMFQEKEEGSIRAYRITPASTSSYILSKTLVFMAIGLVYGFALVMPTIGFSINYLMLGLIIILGSALYSFLGAIVAVFFNNISQWFVVGTCLLMLNMTPILSHLFPNFAPQFITWIPSYSILFIFHEIMFSTGKNLTPWIATLLMMTTIAYAICHLLVDRKLMKEGY